MKKKVVEKLKKNIAIIGYNIFAPGGTTRSNLNLLKEFSSSDYNLIYFNLVEFIKKDVKKLRDTEGLNVSIKFFPLQKLTEYMDIDVYIITRESLFKLAKVIKKINPNSKVIGELHGPLSLIKENISETLPYFDCIRVATHSIKEQFIKKYHFDRVFVQTVSLHHLKSISKKKSQITNNLLIYSRFDEEAKDIAYAIKLVAHIVHELGFQHIRLYINGYGNGELLYRKLIKEYDVTNNVIINGEIPDHYIYVCTSRYETFGYSIVEAICQGHRAAIYYGDDNVIFENFGDFKTVCWLTKNVVEDGKKLVQFVKSEPNDNGIEHDFQLISTISADYVTRFMENISMFEAPKDGVEISEEEIQKLLGKESTVKKFYQFLKHVPLIGAILTNQAFKEFVKKIIK